MDHGLLELLDLEFNISVFQLSACFSFNSIRVEESTAQLQIVLLASAQFLLLMEYVLKHYPPAPLTVFNNTAMIHHVMTVMDMVSRQFAEA
ncbi:hypothetical protein E4U24_002521 [Claviceps purpurea]|nr:hypothetical protein E4U25_002023 [Claviceps purpurea]KAG6248756.1 hypothetical protein E4U24_002521 [Claviceps purpurea]KAG6265827.1 hypothetical protein E4U49_000750 [Claviceps purpurea]